ncbi:splicing factor Cactin-like isoform X1 [Prosopis cineraria]|uniref:splicing factor Cactin-like isoform X1 n=1 Tax=Prosopis cineraria TaxID=364024 RepID=UPI00240EA8C7|nr:splicing factor Cactin-like isoform X1 [Prosopis cineraria]XP_054803500.1 splicing factor Cactin-like isoform X1 [Prosopis cineraria]
MGSGSRRERSRRSRRSSDDSESESSFLSDESGSRQSSPERGSDKRRSSHRSRSSSRRSQRRSAPAEQDSDDSDQRSRKKKSSSRIITEEEIQEYLAKKAQRKAMKVAKKLKTHTVSGYANDSNPFGDSNLNEKFVWRKKIERDVSQGIPLDNFSVKAEKKRQRERMAEIEKVKKRREERALEKAQHEEEMAILARERARAEFQDWEKKEEEFHFDQSKVRSEIRLREGRAKPIDILTKHLSGSDDLDIEINEPYMVFKGLTVKEMEELRDDIKMHLDLDRETPTHVEYWEALLVVCDWELAEARKKDALDRARVRGEEPPAELLAEERGLHASVEAEVKNLLQGKTCAELEAMRVHIESQMSSGTAKVVEYWEAVLKRLHIYKAKATLKEIHEKMLRKHLQRLEQPLEGEHKLENAYDSKSEVEDIQDDVKVQSVDETYSPEPMKGEDQEAEDEPGSFSPVLLHGDENEEAIDPEEDRAVLERKRMAVMEEQQRRIQEAMASKPAPSEDNFEMKAMKAMGAMEEGDALFGSGAEVNLDSQVYWWHDKYRPRKPKYFNRVHTGYEWNKYNQTHYDHDNPPPKIVQGYKFNIFYPDLVDKTKAPTYTIEKDGSNGETCIIRFHAGPPYEDIAFRIVNKEWEYSHKKGFKCTFERGILHVYFNFKRYRYRR